MTGWLAIGFVFYASMALLITHSNIEAVSGISPVGKYGVAGRSLALVLCGVLWPALLVAGFVHHRRKRSHR